MTNVKPPSNAGGTGVHMAGELASQPDAWASATKLVTTSRLPAPGSRVAVIGCGTSWFMAQCYATLRERSGQGPTDAFAASEALLNRDYDAIIAVTRSGTTTEVLEALEGVRGQVRTIGIVGDSDTPVVDLVDEVIALPFADEKSVVQTRFATTVLALLRTSLGEDLTQTIAAARDAVVDDLDERLLVADQYSFLGSGWTIGLAHEAALKMREASQSWTESYPAKEYRHGPISIAEPGRVTWMLGEAPDGMRTAVTATGAHYEHREIDAMAELIRVQRVALERSRRAGLDADTPRNLTRSVVLDS